jgi:hypothetical protein
VNSKATMNTSKARVAKAATVRMGDGPATHGTRPVEQSKTGASLGVQIFVFENNPVRLRRSMAPDHSVER